MIAKITRGDRMRGLVFYLLGPGRHEEHTDQRVIAASGGIDVRHGVELSKREAAELAAALDTPKGLYGVDVAGGYVWQLSLTNRADDRDLTDEQWADAVRHVLDRVGFDPGEGAVTPWVAVRHGRSAGGNDHVHVAVSLVREDGTKVSLWRDRVKVSDACRELEDRYQLVVVAGRSGATATRWPGRNEWEATHGATRRSDDGRQPVPAAGERGQAPRSSREQTAMIVRAVAVASRDETEFVRRLRHAGYRVQARPVAGEPDEIGGYSVALHEDGARWHAGGKLAKDLSLPRLRERWSTDRAPAERWVEAGAALQPSPGRHAAASGVGGGGEDRREERPIAGERWQEAVRWTRGHVDAVVASGDPHDASELARGGAGVAAALASRLEPGHAGPLGELAAALARYPHPPPSGGRRDGEGALAAVAVIALQASKTGQRAAIVALALELVRLADALCRLSQSRQRLEYARAVTGAARGVRQVAEQPRVGQAAVWQIEPASAMKPGDDGIEAARRRLERGRDHHPQR